jgi:MFS family permease
MPRRRKASALGVSLVLALGFVVNYIDRGNVAVAGPLLRAEFGVSPAQLGLLFSSFFLAYACMQVPAGFLVDRFHLKWLYAGAFVLWSASNAAVALAGSFTGVLILRLILSAGESISLPASSKVLAAEFREEERGIANGIIDSGYKFGPAIGTMFGGLFLAHYSWRALFAVTGLGGLIWLIPWFRIADSMTTAAAARETPSLRTRDILLNVRAWATFLGNFCGGYVWALMLSWIPSYLVTERHMSMTRMGIFGSLLFVGTGVTSVAAGCITDRLIRRGTDAGKVRIRFAAAGLLLATLIVPAGLAPDPRAGYAFLLVACACFGLYSSNVWAISQSIAGPRNIGRWSGVQNLIGNLGSVASPAVTGWVVTATGSFQVAFVITAFVLVIGVAIYLLVVRTLEPIRISGQSVATLGPSAGSPAESA